MAFISLPPLYLLSKPPPFFNLAINPHKIYVKYKFEKSHITVPELTSVSTDWL